MGAACTAHLTHYTNHSGLCNQTNFAFSEIFIKDSAIWEAEQDKKCVECLQYMFSRDVLLTPCALLHVFKRCVANTMCAAVNRPEVSPSTSTINIYSSYQNTFKTAIHSPLPPPPQPSVLFIPSLSPLTLMLKT